MDEKFRALDDQLQTTTHLHDNIEDLLRQGLPIIHEQVNEIGTRMLVFSEIWSYVSPT
jgi:hypothetical protein